jgi:hypothetical protein
VPVRTDSRQVIKALAAVDPSALVTRCRADALARLAGALGVAKSGPKAAVASRIVARAQLLDRLLYVGDDPAAMARTFRAESLRQLASQLGLFLGVPKYGLAAQVIDRRDALLRSIQHDLTNGT